MDSSERNEKSITSKTETEEKDEQAMDIVKAMAVAAGIGFAAWGMSKLLGWGSESSGNRKMMKAPGRDFQIYRDVFESDPADYFRNVKEGHQVDQDDQVRSISVVKQNSGVKQSPLAQQCDTVRSPLAQQCNAVRNKLNHDSYGPYVASRIKEKVEENG